MSQAAPASKPFANEPPPGRAHPSPAAEHRLFAGPFVRILWVQLGFGVSFSAFLLLPKFLRQELGAGPDEIGTLSGAALLWAALAAPLVGLSARRVSRKLLLTVALVLEGGASLAFVLVERIGPLIYVLRALQGIAFVVVFNCTSTYAAEVAPKNQLAKAVGFLGVSMLVTNALAPLLTEPLAMRLGWDFAFVVSGLCAWGALSLVPALPAQLAHSRTAESSASFTPALLSVHFGSLMMGGGLGVMFTFVQPYALSQGAREVGDFFLGYVPAALLVRTVLGDWSDRFGHVRTSLLAMFLYALVVGASSILTPSTLALFGAGLGIAHGFLYPALSATGLSRTSAATRSVFMGWFSFAFNAGFAIAVLLLGQLAARAGYAPVFWITGLCLLSGMVPLFLTLGTARAAGS